MKKRIMVCAVLFLLSVGCDRMRWFYDYMDWYIIYRIDEYFDIDERQEKFLCNKVAAFHAWHRKEEIPRLIALLKRIKRELGSGINRENLSWIKNEFDELKIRIDSRVAPDIGQFMSTLGEEQIDHFSRQLIKSNEKYEKKITEPEEKWRESEQKKMLSRMEKWFGDLTGKQKDAIVADLELSRQKLKDNYERRQKVQAKMVRMLREKKDSAEIRSVVSAWFLAPNPLQADKHNTVEKDRQQSWMKVWLKLETVLTGRQRQHASRKLQKYIEDLEAIRAGG